MKQTFISNIIIPEGEPPSEVLLLKYGKTETTEGPYYLDEKGADSVQRIFYKRDIDLYFDYDHKSLDPETPEQGKAAAWFELEKRVDGIWAKGIKWTPQAAEYLKNREYRYFSPVIKTDNTGNVYRLVNVALTNLPATDDLEPLIELKDKQMTETATLDVIETVAEVIDEITDAIIEEVTDTKIDGEQMKQHLDRIDSALDQLMGLGHVMNRHMMEMSEEGMKACFDKVHGQVLKMIDLMKEKRKEFDPHGMYMEKMYKEPSEELKVLTEKVDFTTSALREAQEASKALSEKISEKDGEIKVLSDKIALREKETLIDKAIEGPEKKLLLKQRNWALSLNKEQLETYLESAPVLNLSEKIVDKKVEEPKAEISEIQLKALAMLEKSSGVKVDVQEFLNKKKELGLV